MKLLTLPLMQLTPPLKPLTLLLTALALSLSLPPLRVLIEQSMVWHMLVQMPLLVAAGACAAAA